MKPGNMEPSTVQGWTMRDYGLAIFICAATYTCLCALEIIVVALQWIRRYVKFVAMFQSQLSS